MKLEAVELYRDVSTGASTINQFVMDHKGHKLEISWTASSFTGTCIDCPTTKFSSIECLIGKILLLVKGELE